MSSKKRLTVLISCEHAGANVPTAYKKYFKNRKGLLQTHRGFDRGALLMAKDLAKATQAKLFYSTVSRLVVDLNRSLDQDDLHWSGLNSLSQSEKDKIIRTFWQPHRQRVEQAILSLLKKGSVVHIGSHSFTPRLRGKVRSVDIGILFDPSSKKESKFAEHWIKNLKLEFPKLKIQKNSPYKGTSDGFTTSLRKLSKSYLGLELEINQRHLVNGQFPAKFRRHIIKSLPKT